MDLVHYILPYFPGIGGAVDARHIPWYIITNPDSGGIVARITAEPRILTAVGGPCLACGRHAAVQFQTASGAVRGCKRPFEDIGQHEC